VNRLDRGAAMAASLARALRAHGVEGVGARLVARAYTRAMAPRVDALEDDHHPSYLHPGRVALILLRDVGVTDEEVLAASCLAESDEEAYRLGEDDLRASFGDRVARLAAVPRATLDELAEALVTASHEARLVALAERLDQVRHAHLRRDRDDDWKMSVFEGVRSIYLPIAERTHPRLALRFRNWSKAFARRLGPA
jgi:(p)ppGpp synthase/HD superfamily hydrolase